MVHFDHESVYNLVANRYSAPNVRSGGWPGFVDFEDGELSGKSTKPSFPTKGIYPNKNTEKSKLFYGMRGVRQRAALFINSVDNRLPRVVLNRTMIIDAAANVPKGIIHLATVDNYDRVEWYRTFDGGKTWQLLIGIRNADELVEKFTKTEIRYDSSGNPVYDSYGNVIKDTYIDYEEALGGYYTEIAIAAKDNCCDLSHGEFYSPFVSSGNYTVSVPEGQEHLMPQRGFVADDRNKYLSLFQYGELEANIPMGGHLVESYNIYEPSTGRYFTKVTPRYRDTPSYDNYGCHTDIAGIKCRVYKGDAWVDSNTILANGTIIESAGSYQPSEIKIAFVSEWSVGFNMRKLTIYHKATASGVISPRWEVSKDAWSGWEACAYGSNTWNLYRHSMPCSPEDVEQIKLSIIDGIPAYDYYVRCRDLVTKKVSNILRVTCEAGQETPTVKEIILPRINPAEYSRSESLSTHIDEATPRELLWVDDYVSPDNITIYWRMPYVDGSVWIDVDDGVKQFPIGCYDTHEGFSPEEQCGTVGEFTLWRTTNSCEVHMRFKEGTVHIPGGVLWDYEDIISQGYTTILTLKIDAKYNSTSYTKGISVGDTPPTYSIGVTHQISTTVTDAKTLQWQELKSGTWKDMDGETSETLVLGTWTGDTGADEETARANANAVIPAYDRQFRCVATNIAGTTTEEIRVTHEEGNGTPTVT